MRLTQWLNSASCERSEALALLEARLKLTRSHILTHGDAPINPPYLAQLACDLTRLQAGEPLAYILGTQAFWRLELTVTPDVLIPRPDTETLVEHALRYIPKTPGVRLLDLGTGSGAVALALAQERPLANITATDASAKALAVSQHNAARNHIQNVHFQQGHWQDWYAGLDGQRFDVIVSNPPYIAENDPHLPALQHEPITALTAPDAGLADLQAIIQGARQHLHAQGVLLLEHGYDQGAAVRDYLEQNGFIHIQTHRDLGNNERVTLASITTQNY